MSPERNADLPRSVHQRLLNRARATGRPFGELLQYFAMERFLDRLARSPHREEFLVRGALMLGVWGVPAPRATMDIDLLGREGLSPSDLEAAVRACLAVPAEDGLVFHPESVTVEPIRGGDEFLGLRLLFRAHLGNARIQLQLDVGLGDAVVPPPEWFDLPCLLDFATPRLRGYRPETAIAEKFDAMLKLDMANSRMKDFYDLAILAAHLPFEGRVLQDALRRTLERRGAAVPAEIPTALTEAFFESPVKIAQWAAFARRLPQTTAPPALRQTVEAIRTFLLPPVLALSKEEAFEALWPPGGPWNAVSSETKGADR